MKAVGARRRGEISAILALCLATIGSSCGGDGGDAAGPTTTINQNAKAQAEAIVVKLSDLPAGYRVYTSSKTGEEGVGEGPDVSDECAGTESIKDKVIGDADDAEYETDLTYLSSDAAIFASPEDAEAAMAQLREVVADPTFEDCLEEVMEKSIVEGTEVGEVTVSDLEVSCRRAPTSSSLGACRFRSKSWTPPPGRSSSRPGWTSHFYGAGMQPPASSRSG